MGKKKKIATLTRENLRLRIELFRSRKMGSLKGVAWESMNGGLLESMRMLEGVKTRQPSCANGSRSCSKRAKQTLPTTLTTMQPWLRTCSSATTRPAAVSAMAQLQGAFALRFRIQAASCNYQTHGDLW